MTPPTIGRDLMARTWWALCSHGCGWSTAGEPSATAAFFEQTDHEAGCLLKPGPEPPPPIAPPPARPV